jgi:hypothetical protein
LKSIASWANRRGLPPVAPEVCAVDEETCESSAKGALAIRKKTTAGRERTLQLVIYESAHHRHV